MKKRKRNLLQRMMAVLLSAVLAAGWMQNTAPAVVLAEEGGKMHARTYTIFVRGYVEGYDLPETAFPSEVKAVQDGVIEIKAEYEETTHEEVSDSGESYLMQTHRYILNLPNGTYDIYAGETVLKEGEVITDSSGSGLSVGAKYYYAVRFYDGDELKNVIYALRGTSVPAPEGLTKEGCEFAGWVTENGGSTPFDFSAQISRLTDVYASWKEETPAHEHEWDENWSKDDTAHWHTCIAENCPVEWTGENLKEADGYGPHDWAVITSEDTVTPTCTQDGWEVLECRTCRRISGRAVDALGHEWGEWNVLEEPTETEPGKKERVCGRCSEKQTEEIPAAGAGENSGNFGQSVEKDDKAPATQLATSAEQLKEMILTDEEKEQLAAGTDISIVLAVKDASASAGSEDRTAAEAALSGSAEGFAIGQYLDISLSKIIGGTKSAISETDGTITVTIAVPDSLKNTDSRSTRTFAVIRVHNGTAALLNDQDDNADTITIATDRFSTYAIVYKDTSGDGDGGNSGSGGSGNGGSGDSGNSGSGGSGNSGSGGSGNTDSGSGNADSGDSGNSGSGNADSANTGNAGSNTAGANNITGNNSNIAGVNSGSTTGGSDNNAVHPASAKDGEPRTGDSAPLELYATLAMIAGFSYLLLYFADRMGGMTEETKKELVGRLAAWAKRGGKYRKYLALAAIFVLLVYYHSIGKKICAEWKEAYGE